MKKRLVLLLLCLTPLLHALAGAEIEISGAALYWQPCTSGHAFATTGVVAGNLTSIDLVSVTPDYDWGVRMGAKYTNTCSNLWIAFDAARLWAVNRGRLEGGGFNATLIPGATIPALSVKDTLDIDYYTIDVSGGHTWRCGRRLSADLYVLGRYAFLRRQEMGAALGSGAPVVVQTLRLNGRFKGAGFGLGFKSHYAVACGFSIRTNLLIGGLYGDQLYATFTNITQNDAPAGSTRLRDTHFACVPFFDVIAALEYARCFCDFIVIAGQIGWEANHYFGAIPIPGDTSLTVGIHRERIGFGGPFAKLALRF